MTLSFLFTLAFVGYFVFKNDDSSNSDYKKLRAGDSFENKLVSSNSTPNLKSNVSTMQPKATSEVIKYQSNNDILQALYKDGIKIEFRKVLFKNGEMIANKVGALSKSQLVEFLEENQ